MNFKSIDYFLSVARERSFTKAAAQHHITQQTISADIAALERELGQPLFLRKVPLKLTYAGEVFLRYAQGFQNSHTAMLQEFRDIAKEETGILRIGVTYARGHALMPQLIAAFQRDYPGVSIHLLEDSNEQLQKHLLEGRVDLAIANYTQAPSDIELIPFYREELVLLISDRLLEQIYRAEKEQVLADLERGRYGALAQCPFVLGIPDDIGGAIGRRFLRQQKLQPAILAQSENMDTLLSLCALGVGACFSPENLISTTLTNAQYRELHVIRLPEATYQIHFGVRKNTYQWSMIQAFIRSVQGSNSTRSNSSY